MNKFKYVLKVYNDKKVSLQNHDEFSTALKDYVDSLGDGHRVELYRYEFGQSGDIVKVEQYKEVWDEIAR